MSEKKKVKLRVKKKKLNIKRIIMLILIILLLVLLFLLVNNLPLKNIYVTGNNILSDKEIIEEAGLEDYPKLIKINNKKIIDRLKKNIFIKDVSLKVKLSGKIYLQITERKVLCTYNNEVYLEGNLKAPFDDSFSNYPILTSDITTIMKRFTEKFSLVNDDILLKISEIAYVPNEVDNERFILKMNDGNIVYITLSKVSKINKYNSIYSEMAGKKGIIYLDSGDYVEVKE